MKSTVVIALLAFFGSVTVWPAFGKDNPDQLLAQGYGQPSQGYNPGFGGGMNPGYAAPAQNYSAPAYPMGNQSGFNQMGAPNYAQQGGGQFSTPAFSPGPSQMGYGGGAPGNYAQPAPVGQYGGGQYGAMNMRPQAFPQVSLGNMLNQADSNWSNTPISHPPANNSMNQGGMSQGQPGRAFAPFNGMRQPLQSGPAPFSPQNLLRIFMGGGTGSGGGFGGGTAGNSPEKQANDASMTGQAEGLLQRANDQAAQAEADAERASSGSDRQSAASSAQYHANDARAAADTAASITYSGPEYAKDYAAQARDAANRAQAAADRAAYNASQQ